VKLGDIANPDAVRYGKPLDGVRILAAEQMQSLPYATQLLARLGAEVVKVENPGTGDIGRGSLPALIDADGRKMGCTFVRNNLGKKSIGIDLKSPAGRDLFLSMVPRFDVVAENFKPGTMDKFGLGYDDLAKVHPAVIYASISGFGNTVESEYRDWPAFAPVAEAMSGLYEISRRKAEPPVISPVGGLGDTGAGLFAVVGILAALRHRDRTGVGQYVDIAMYDCMVSFADMVPNYWSMGMELSGDNKAPLINHGFRASDGWFIVQVGRPHQFARLCEIIGKPEWLEDDRLKDGFGWLAHIEDVIRPGIEGWAGDRGKHEICDVLAKAGIACGPLHAVTDVVDDPHVQRRNMLVEIPRTDGVEQPALAGGNPVKLTKMAEGPETAPPTLGEHTDEVLRSELGLDHDAIAVLRAAGTVV
jgi:crotonobetainyl-CoA:carnitine CoA-transferase CaiB-like acyl-CoA transferase